MTKFHQNLKELRLEKELRQKDLAEIIGVDQRTISNWEVAKVEPDLSMLVKIAEYFEVTTDYLLTGK